MIWLILEIISFYLVIGLCCVVPVIRGDSYVRNRFSFVTTLVFWLPILIWHLIQLRNDARRGK